MMNKLYIAITTVLLAIPSAQVLAAEVNNNDVVPPTQTQKDQVPNSTENGNYLEPQPDNNGATTDAKDKHDQKSHKAKSKKAKPNNLEKSKKVTEDPANGGVDVKPN